MIWISGLLAFAGFASIALSMDRHQATIEAARASMSPPDSISGRRLARCGGYAVLALAAWPATQTWGPSIGIAAWLGVLTVSALCLILLLAYRPDSVPALARLALLSGLLAWLL
jgi:hypothetical protein